MQNDPSELLTCPYESCHRIQRLRFQKHLIKCRNNHKNSAKVTCPFNVTHVVNAQELTWHTQNCPERLSFETYKHVEQNFANQNPSDSQLGFHPGFSTFDSSDENEQEVPAYNPQAYVQNAPVLRGIQGAPPSERRRFRKEERLRLQDIKRKNNQ